MDLSATDGPSSNLFDDKLDHMPQTQSVQSLALESEPALLLLPCRGRSHQDCQANVMESQMADERTGLLDAEEQQQGRTLENAVANARSDPQHDSDNPLNWTRRAKWKTVALLFFASFTVTSNCMSVMPVARHIVQDLDQVGDAESSASVLLVTIWEMGEAAGPLIIGPLSEVTGRYAMLNTAGTLFAVTTLLAATSKSVSQLIASRALTGMAVASNVLNPAIIGDLFPPEERGTAMSVIMFAPLLGSTLGPALGGFLAETWGWRSVLHLCLVLATLAELAFLTCLKETYYPIIAERRAAVQSRAIMARSDLRRGPKGKTAAKPLLNGFAASMLRPGVVLVRSAVILSLAIFGSVVFAQIYVLAVTMPIVLEDVYGLPPSAIGSAFFANAFGAMISVLFCNLALDKIYVRLRDANNGVGLPEHRLPVCIIGALTLPPALALYGWCAQHHLSLTVCLVSVISVRFSMLLVIVPLMAYVVDACGVYSASAMTGVIVLRCLSGAFVPLAMVPTVESLGYGWGFTALAIFCLILALIPLLIQRYGVKWRSYSAFTSIEEAP